MGLALEVGILADLHENDEEGFRYYRDTFQRLKAWLATKGLTHEEPESLATREIFSCSMIGYSGLHTLRRVAAYLHLKDTLPKPVDFRIASKDPILGKIYEDVGPGGSQYDHLMLHSDAEGVYLPCRFKEVLYPPEHLKIPGG